MRRRLLGWSMRMVDAGVAGEDVVIEWGQKALLKASCSSFLFFILINIMNLKNASLESTHHINFFPLSATAIDGFQLSG